MAMSIQFMDSLVKVIDGQPSLALTFATTENNMLFMEGFLFESSVSEWSERREYHHHRCGRGRL